MNEDQLVWSSLEQFCTSLLSDPVRNKYNLAKWLRNGSHEYSVARRRDRLKANSTTVASQLDSLLSQRYQTRKSYSSQDRKQLTRSLENLAKHGHQRRTSRSQRQYLHLAKSMHSTLADTRPTSLVDEIAELFCTILTARFKLEIEVQNNRGVVVYLFGRADNPHLSIQGTTLFKSECILLDYLASQVRIWADPQASYVRMGQEFIVANEHGNSSCEVNINRSGLLAHVIFAVQAHADLGGQQVLVAALGSLLTKPHVRQHGLLSDVAQLQQVVARGFRHRGEVDTPTTELTHTFASAKDVRWDVLPKRA